MWMATLWWVRIKGDVIMDEYYDFHTIKSIIDKNKIWKKLDERIKYIGKKYLSMVNKNNWYDEIYWMFTQQDCPVRKENEAFHNFYWKVDAFEDPIEGCKLVIEFSDRDEPFSDYNAYLIFELEVLNMNDDELSEYLNKVITGENQRETDRKIKEKEERDLKNIESEKRELKELINKYGIPKEEE